MFMFVYDGRPVCRSERSKHVECLESLSMNGSRGGEILIVRFVLQWTCFCLRSLYLVKLRV